jgi:hypothetical protein
MSGIEMGVGNEDPFGIALGPSTEDGNDSPAEPAKPSRARTLTERLAEAKADRDADPDGDEIVI